uniref:Integrase catalytic domain-containing protein n=1 Tax=Latimeria chalumnae TaxID=7897 RepID=H2ZWE5_LATCH
IKTDNGLQFSSQEFQKFMKTWEIEHVTVSPRYPQANGLAEKAKTAKRLLEKSRAEGNNPYLSILEYRNTPIGYCGSSAQMLMNRRLKSKLPCIEKLLMPKMHKMPVEIQKEITCSRQSQKLQYDKAAKELPELVTGEQVHIQNNINKCWNLATVVRLVSTPRSYWVKAGEKLLKQNCRQILKINNVKGRASEKMEVEQKTIETEQEENKESMELGESPENIIQYKTSRGRIVCRPTKYED